MSNKDRIIKIWTNKSPLRLCPNSLKIGKLILSIIGGLLAVIIGLYSSLSFNSASGPSIIVAASVLFMLSMLNIKKFRQLKK